MHRWLTALAPTTAAIALLIPAAAPAQAVAPPGSELFLLWSRYDGVDEPHHTATLVCDTDPATGTHPDPLAACAAMELAGGDPLALADDDRPCTDEYDPLGVLMIGTWGGVEVFYTRDFLNPCQAARFTAGVYDFT